MFMNLAAVKLTKVGPKKGTKLLVVEYLKQKGDRLVVVHNAVACALVYVTTLQNDIKVESHFIMDVSSRRFTAVGKPTCKLIHSTSGTRRITPIATRSSKHESWLTSLQHDTFCPCARWRHDAVVHYQYLSSFTFTLSTNKFDSSTLFRCSGL